MSGFLPAHIVAAEVCTSFFCDKNSDPNKLGSKLIASTPEENTSENKAVANSSPKIETTEQSSATQIQFVNSDPKSHIVSPDKDPAIRINPEAPGPFKAMAERFQAGDMQTAFAYARQYARYQNRLMADVSALTALIGKAMIAEGIITEEQWFGADQYLKYNLAKARKDSNSPLKITEKDTLPLIKSVSGGEIEIFYFFTVQSEHARRMSPEVERLYRILKNDSRVKMLALSMIDEKQEIIDQYKQYTGLTMPIARGEEMSKAMGIAFAPAVVVLSKNDKRGYSRSGEQGFESLYTFVKTIQGEKVDLTALEQSGILSTPIGAAAKSREDSIRAQYKSVKGKAQPANSSASGLSRF